MFCQKCGKEIPEGASICPSCGTLAGQTGATADITAQFADLQKKMQEKLNGMSIESKLNMILLFTGFTAFVVLVVLIRIWSFMNSFGRMF